MGRSSSPTEADHYMPTASGCMDDFGWGPIHVSKLPRACLQHLLLQQLDCLMSFWHLEKTCNGPLASMAGWCCPVLWLLYCYWVQGVIISSP